jgi:hypothetical protein
MEKELTELQRKAMAALQAARAAGVGLSAYGRANGLNVRQLHDAVTGLRKRGLIPATKRAQRRSGAFVAVKVVDLPSRGPDVARAPRVGMVCRLVHVAGLVIECGEWPPAAWLQSLVWGHRDAAS